MTSSVTSRGASMNVHGPRGRTRALIVGSGIAGLTTALELGDCMVITRSELGDGSSRWAQGGIAAALGEGDAPDRHAADTLTVSSGLSVPAIVEMITAAAPERVRWLQHLGAELDLDGDGMLALGREAGHSDRRIVHAGGDATGAAVMQALVAAVRERPDITVLEHQHVRDLVRADGQVVGVTTTGPRGGSEVLLADAVVLATGGIGRVYARTTNPVEATGDGLAMALRAGAIIRDPEFVQFHPTALDATHDPLPLLTEALRGEGAHLVDAAGRRYLVGEHPDAELAPRDVVARANWRQRRRGPIYLDARMIGDDFPTRFPTVFRAAMAAGIDPRRQPIPTTPAQHYHIGGIRTDGHGRTSLPGLFACGEAASVGLHGANRLASNSLVEGLVMGARVAGAIGHQGSRTIDPRRLQVPAPPTHAASPNSTREGGAAATVTRRDVTSHIDIPDLDGGGAADAIARLREVMWEHGGLLRHADGLRAALEELDHLTPELARDDVGRNLAVVAEVVLRAALARDGSRGGHHRIDHPENEPGPGRHTLVQRDDVPHVPLDGSAGLGGSDIRREVAS